MTRVVMVVLNLQLPGGWNRYGISGKELVSIQRQKLALA